MKISNTHGVRAVLAVIGLSFAAILPFSARAGLYSDYEPTGLTFSVPSSAYDVSGGLLYYLQGDTLYRQDAINVDSFTAVGHFDSGLSLNSFPAFVEISPDGTKVAIGNSGGADFATYQVAVFDTALLSVLNPDLSGSSSIYNVGHSSAAWVDNNNLLLTAGTFGQPGVVTCLDVTSPTGSPSNSVVIDNIGGASAGVAVDALGNLFTGNGFDGTGPSDTGWIKAINATAWTTSPPVDFELSLDSTFVADLLSANSLQFDTEGNLLVGGGDFGSSDNNYFALIAASALSDLLQNGTPIDTGNLLQVRSFDPSSDSSFYTLAVDLDNNVFYALDGTTAYQYSAVPEPSTFALMAIGGVACLLLVRRRLRRRAARLTAMALLFGILSTGANASNFYAEEVVNFSPGTGVTEGVGFGITSRVLGGPRGGGISEAGLDVLSLGEGGSLTLGFNSQWIEDGAGSDFIVFENPFIVGGNPSTVFAELFFVEVSSDGTNFARFDSLSLNPGPISAFGTLDPALVSGLGGTGPVLANIDTNAIDPFDPATAGGNAFDLAALASNPLVLAGTVDLTHIGYVRLIDIFGDGSVLDSQGNPVYDVTGFNNSADIDSLAVIHGIPEPGTIALMGIGLAIAAVFVKRRA